MSYDYDFAKRIQELRKKNPYEAAWYKAICSSIDPLAFTIIDGNLIYKTGEGLTMTQTAVNTEWRVGYQAAAFLSGEGLLVIGRI